MVLEYYKSKEETRSLVKVTFFINLENDFLLLVEKWSQTQMSFTSSDHVFNDHAADMYSFWGGEAEENIYDLMRY